MCGRSWPTCSVGRRVTPERVEEVAHHYELFGGVSPLTELTKRQAALLGERLSSEAVPLPVYLGMRNWHPYLKDTLAQMSRDGVRRAVGFIAAAQRSYSSCTQYRENVDVARAALRRGGAAGRLRHLCWRLAHASRDSSKRTPAHVTAALATLPPTYASRCAHRVHRAQHPRVDGGTLALSAAPGRVRRRDRRPSRDAATARSCIRAAAAVRKTPGSGPTSAII